MKTAEDALGEELSDLCLQSSGLGVDGTITASVRLHQSSQLLTEVSNRKWIARSIVVERPEPAVSAECHHALGRNQEALLRPGLPLRFHKALKVHRRSVPEHLASAWLPNTSHSLAKIEFQEALDVLVPIQAMLGKVSEDGLHIEE